MQYYTIQTDIQQKQNKIRIKEKKQEGTVIRFCGYRKSAGIPTGFVGMGWVWGLKYRTEGNAVPPPTWLNRVHPPPEVVTMLGNGT